MFARLTIAGPIGSLKRHLDSLLLASPLIGASAIYVLLNLAALPVITRYFGPNHYGVYVVSFSIIMIAGAVSNLRLQLALMLPEDESDVRMLSVASRSAALFVAGVLVFLLWLSDHSAYAIGVAPNLGNLVLIAMTVVCIGSFQTDQSLLQRFGRFRLMAVGRVVQGAAFFLAAISFGMLGFLDVGLLLALLISYFSAATFSYLAASQLIEPQRQSWKRLQEVIGKYWQFPTLSTLGALLDAAASNLPVLLVAYVLGNGEAGIFGLAVFLLNAPITTIARSVGQVLYQKYSRAANPVERSRVFISVSASLALLSLSGYAVLAWVVAPFLEQFLGADWSFVEQLVPLLSLSFALRFVVSPLSLILTTHLRLTSAVLWQLGYFVAFVTVFHFYEVDDLAQFAATFVLLDVIVYLIYFAMILNAVIRGKNQCAV